MKHPAALVLSEDSRRIIYTEPVMRRLEAHVEWVAPPMTAEAARAGAGTLSGAEFLFTGWGAPKCDAAFLAALPNLKAVFYGAGSIRGTVTDAFWERGIPIMSAWGANAVPVAEFAFSQIIFALKHGWHYTNAVRRDGRHLPKFAPTGAFGATVGLVSFGMIARKVAEWVKQLAVEIAVYDPFLKASDANDLGMRLVDLDTLFRESDVVSLHTPWLPETVGMVGARHFDLMKPNATFINTARGAVVDEVGMVSVLERRKDLMAVLDVTWPEPPIADSPLWTLPNVVLTPHIAGSADRECARMGHYMADELERLLAGKPLAWSVSRERAATMA
ncbi:MAG: hydroxyacid dehydrogenase [Spirochaetes bacterium]|nr:hydroxyacid dehydrogenase [Spirochaetota bacterium]